ncbi:helix-turn-helix domain-containing protein [Vibrio lentus]
MEIKFDTSALKKKTSLGRKPKFSLEEQKKMYELYKEGYTQRSIAEAFKTSYTTVNNAIKAVEE